MGRKARFILRVTPTRLFLISWAGWTIASFFVLWFEPKATFDIQFHDTYIIFWKYEMVLEVGNLFGLLGLMYYYFPRLFKRPLRRGLGMAHFWMTFFSSLVFIWPYRGLAGMPRRYVDYSSYVSFNQFGMFGDVTSVLVVVGVLAQLVFLVNVVYSMVGRIKSVD
jgi:cytochrome c oxidase subunit 1